jgi:hypothetical protein
MIIPDLNLYIYYERNEQRIFLIMSFPDKIQEIIFAHGRYILRKNDNSYQRKLPTGYMGIDSIEATNKILELIESEIIQANEISKHPGDKEDSRNQLKEEQRIKLHEQKGEKSNFDSVTL